MVASPIIIILLIISAIVIIVGLFSKSIPTVAWALIVFIVIWRFSYKIDSFWRNMGPKYTNNQNSAAVINDITGKIERYPVNYKADLESGLIALNGNNEMIDYFQSKFDLDTYNSLLAQLEISKKNNKPLILKITIFPKDIKLVPHIPGASLYIIKNSLSDQKFSSSDNILLIYKTKGIGKFSGDIMEKKVTVIDGSDRIKNFSTLTCLKNLTDKRQDIEIHLSY